MLARRLGVRPDTVRARARRGALRSMRNPVGPGRLYALHTGDAKETPHAAAVARANRENPASGGGVVLRADDAYILTLLPADAHQIEGATGMSSGSVSRALERLVVAGAAREAAIVAPGPQGGRPARVWEAC
jgi:hypothetical protein